MVAAICKRQYKHASKSTDTNLKKYAAAAPVELTFNTKMLPVNTAKSTLFHLLGGSTGQAQIHLNIRWFVFNGFIFNVQRIQWTFLTVILKITLNIYRNHAINWVSLLESKSQLNLISFVEVFILKLNDITKSQLDCDAQTNVLNVNFETQITKKTSEFILNYFFTFPNETNSIEILWYWFDMKLAWWKGKY